MLKSLPSKDFSRHVAPQFPNLAQNLSAMGGEERLFCIGARERPRNP
ncbi:MAG: hypothetical protein GDA38_11785 [Hormoscilla sp. SP12CHS1]|nr:hypothetical protein [Hormoscilla sp. SP12CHS1]